MEWNFEGHFIVKASVNEVKNNLGVRSLIFFDEPDVLSLKEILSWVSLNLVLGNTQVRHCFKFMLLKDFSDFRICIVIHHSKETGCFGMLICVHVWVSDTLKLSLDGIAIVASGFNCVIHNHIVGSRVFQDQFSFTMNRLMTYLYSLTVKLMTPDVFMA